MNEESLTTNAGCDPDSAAPFFTIEHRGPRSPGVAGRRHLGVLVSHGESTVLGGFGRISITQDQVLVLAPATAYAVEQANGRSTWAAFVHERLAVDLLQWRYQTAGGKVDVWQHLRSRTPPYWRGTVSQEDHASLFDLIARADRFGPTSTAVWEHLDAAVNVVRRVDCFFAQSFDAENFVRVPYADTPVRLRREVARAKAFIEARHTEAITTSNIADHVGLSSSALSRAFRKELGVTPPEYLRAVRVSRFEHLLVESDESIREVARLPGLSSTGHLREHINQKYGMSPRELRVRLRHSS